MLSLFSENSPGVEIPLLFSTIFVFCFLLSCLFSVARITRSTMNSELIFSTQLHILTDQVFVACRILKSMELRVAETTDSFYVVLLFDRSRCNSSHI